MSDELGDRKLASLSFLEEVEALDPVLGLIRPRTASLDLLVAHIKVGAVSRIAVIREESEFAERTAAADILPSSGCSLGRACALEDHLGTFAAGDFHNLLDRARLKAVDGVLSTELLGKRQTLGIAIARDDVSDAHAANHRQEKKANRTATLNEDVAVELEVEDLLCLFDSVNDNGSRLDKDAQIAIHIGDVKHNAAFVDLHVLAEPTVEVVLRARHKTVNFAAIAKLGDFRSELASVASAAGLKTSDDLVANLKGLACEIGLDVLAERNDLARSFMAELNGAILEGITLVFMHVRAANATTFDLHENFIRADLGDCNFLQHHLARLFKNRHFALFRNGHVYFPF